MSRTWRKNKQEQTGLNRRIKWAMKKKRKTFKKWEVNNGNYLDKCLANRWDWD